MTKQRPLFKQSAETIAVLNVLGKAKPGAVVSYGELNREFPTPISPDRLRSAIGSARRILQRDRGMVFSPVPKVGYQLLAADEVVDASDQDVRGMRRRAHRAMAKLATVAGAELSPEKQGKRDARMAIFAVAEGCFDYAKVKRLEAGGGTTKQTVRDGMQRVLQAIADD